MRFLRASLGLRLLDRVRKEEIRTRMGKPTEVVKEIEDGQQRWYVDVPALFDLVSLPQRSFHSFGCNVVVVFVRRMPARVRVCVSVYYETWSLLRKNYSSLLRLFGFRKL